MGYFLVKVVGLSFDILNFWGQLFHLCMLALSHLGEQVNYECLHIIIRFISSGVEIFIFWRAYSSKTNGAIRKIDFRCLKKYFIICWCSIKNLLTCLLLLTIHLFTNIVLFFLVYFITILIKINLLSFVFELKIEKFITFVLNESLLVVNFNSSVLNVV